MSACLPPQPRHARFVAVVLLAAAAGACATADSTVETYGRTQERVTRPVVAGEHFIEDAGARITGTEPAYKQGGSFFVNPDDESSFGFP